MWTLLLKFWKPALGGLIGLWAIWFLHHRGYESGFAASEVKWQARFEAAERALAVANARTEKAEALSNQAVENSQRRIDETLQALHARTVDYDGRLRSLSVRLSAAGAHRCEAASLPRSSPELAGPTESEQRAAEVGASLTRIGSDCEADSLRLREWQRWFTEQRAIFESTAASAGAESLPASRKPE